MKCVCGSVGGARSFRWCLSAAPTQLPAIGRTDDSTAQEISSGTAGSARSTSLHPDLNSAPDVPVSGAVSCVERAPRVASYEGVRQPTNQQIVSLPSGRAPSGMPRRGSPLEHSRDDPGMPRKAGELLSHGCEPTRETLRRSPRAGGGNRPPVSRRARIEDRERGHSAG